MINVKINNDAIKYRNFFQLSFYFVDLNFDYGAITLQQYFKLQQHMLHMPYNSIRRVKEVMLII